MKLTHKKFVEIVEENVKGIPPAEEFTLANGKLYTRFILYEDECYTISLGYTLNTRVTLHIDSRFYSEYLDSKRVKELSRRLDGIAEIMEICGG